MKMIQIKAEITKIIENVQKLKNSRNKSLIITKLEEANHRVLDYIVEEEDVMIKYEAKLPCEYSVNKFTPIGPTPLIKEDVMDDSKFFQQKNETVTFVTDPTGKTEHFVTVTNSDSDVERIRVEGVENPTIGYLQDVEPDITAYWNMREKDLTKEENKMFAAIHGGLTKPEIPLVHDDRIIKLEIANGNYLKEIKRLRKYIGKIESGNVKLKHSLTLYEDDILTDCEKKTLKNCELTTVDSLKVEIEKLDKIFEGKEKEIAELEKCCSEYEEELHKDEVQTLEELERENDERGKFGISVKTPEEIKDEQQPIIRREVIERTRVNPSLDDYFDVDSCLSEVEESTFRFNNKSWVITTTNNSLMLNYEFGLQIGRILFREACHDINNFKSWVNADDNKYNFLLQKGGEYREIFIGPPSLEGATNHIIHYIFQMNQSNDLISIGVYNATLHSVQNFNKQLFENLKKQRWNF